MEKGGFGVKLADDINNDHNILRDIVEGIGDSQLVVADLTGSNPNVLYELGLAHALRKPVMHLTQSLDELNVPFDLSSYRMLVYGTNFMEIREAKEKLEEKARVFLEGGSRFGNPIISDFYQGPIGHHEITATSQGGNCEVAEGARDASLAVNDEDGEPGLLDHVIAVTQGYKVATDTTNELKASLEGLTVEIVATSSEIDRISVNRNASTPVAAKKMCGRLAARFGEFNEEIRKTNAIYAQVLEDTEDSLEWLMTFQVAESGPESLKVADEIKRMQGASNQILEGRQSILSLADVMDGLPRIERRLNREVAMTSGEIRVLAGHLQRISASIARAINMGRLD